MVEFVDLQKYPIMQLEGERGQALVARCQQELESDGSLCLQGFIRPDAIHKMAAEVSDLESFHRLQIVAPYTFVDVSNDVPANHPVILALTCR